MAERIRINLRDIINDEDRLAPGHRLCAGCAEPAVIRQILHAVEEPVVVATATGCMEVSTTVYPFTAWRTPWIHSAFENAATTVTSAEAAYKALQRAGKIPADKQIRFMAIGGDGASYDIGLQWISGALERGHKFVYVCLNNEAYMNTGIQRSGATPFGSSTTTAPAGKASIGNKTWKKNVAEIMVEHGLPYVATACHSYPIDFMNKVKKARSIKGPSYIHCLSVCPTGWRSASETCIKMGRLAVETGVFPLYEVEYGKYRITVDPPEKLRPVSDYLKPQGRFRHLTPDQIQGIQGRVLMEYNKLMNKVNHSKSWDELKAL